LLPAATNVIIANLVQVVLLLLALNGLALAVDDGILRDDAVLRRVNLDYLELDLPHTAPHNKQVALTDRPVCLAEVWGKEDVEERPGDALDGVGDGKNCNTLGLHVMLVTDSCGEPKASSCLRI